MVPPLEAPGHRTVRSARFLEGHSRRGTSAAVKPARTTYPPSRGVPRAGQRYIDDSSDVTVRGPAPLDRGRHPPEPATEPSTAATSGGLRTAGQLTDRVHGSLRIGQDGAAEAGRIEDRRDDVAAEARGLLGRRVGVLDADVDAPVRRHRGGRVAGGRSTARSATR